MNTRKELVSFYVADTCLLESQRSSSLLLVNEGHPEVQGLREGGVSTPAFITGGWWIVWEVGGGEGSGEGSGEGRGGEGRCSNCLYVPGVNVQYQFSPEKCMATRVRRVPVEAGSRLKLVESNQE